MSGNAETPGETVEGVVSGDAETPGETVEGVVSGDAETPGETVEGVVSGDAETPGETVEGVVSGDAETPGETVEGVVSGDAETPGETVEGVSVVAGTPNSAAARFTPIPPLTASIAPVIASSLQFLNLVPVRSLLGGTYNTDTLPLAWHLQTVQMVHSVLKPPISFYTMQSETLTSKRARSIHLYS